jgi:hypothetical protein
VISLAALVCLAGLIGIIAASAYSGAVARHGSQKITMNHVFNGTFYAESHELQWAPQGMLSRRYMRDLVSSLDNSWGWRHKLRGSRSYRIGRLEDKYDEQISRF